MCSLHLTHPSAHTPGAVGSQHCGARGAVGGSVKGLTSVVDNSCRSRDSNPQPRVTSPFLHLKTLDILLLIVRAVTVADFYHRGGNRKTTAGGAVLLYIYI